MTFDASWVYFVAADPSQGHSLRAVPLGGGPARTIASGLDTDVVALAVDACYVYFLAESARGFVERVSLSGGAPQVLATQVLTSSNTRLNAIALDGSYVYWTQSDGPWTETDAGFGAAVGSVWRVPLTGGTSEALATSLVGPQEIAVDGTGLYWLDYGTTNLNTSSACQSTDGALLALTSGSSAVTTLASGLVGPSSLAVRAGDVYWGTRGFFCGFHAFAPPDGTVTKRAASGSLTTVALGVSDPGNLFVDDANLYFTQVADPNTSGALAAATIPR